MVFSLIKIRFLQVGREIQYLGLFRAMVLLVIVLLLAAMLFLQTASLTGAVYASAVVLLLIFLLHSKRKDKQFLRMASGYHKWVIFAEYILGSLLLTVPLLIHGFWLVALAFVLLTGMIIQADISTGNFVYAGWLLRRIPDDCFEWKSGLRKQFVLLAIIWISGVLLSFYLAAVPVAMFFSGLIFMSFFENGEPYQMVIAFEMSPGRFLWHKIKWQLALVTIFFVPLAAAFMVFFLKLWYVPLIILAAFYLLLIYTVVVKYAFYEPDSRSYAAQVFVAIGIFGMIIPVFAPLVLFLAIWFYQKSLKKLKFYLDDYH